MPSTARPRLATRSNDFGTPAHQAAVVGLLLALVLLVVFGAVVSRLAQRADSAKDAALMVQHDRMDCEQHALAVARRDCKQALQGAWQSR